MSLFNTIRFIAGHPLTCGHKFSAMIRFAKWQLGSRLARGAIVYDWVNGAKFWVKTGETGLTGNIYTGLHEFSDMGFLLHFLRREDLFVDVGANVGSYTILACAAVGARGVAFEPIPGTYQRLVENIRLNRLEERVTCLNKGVGTEEGAITFTSDRDTTNHALASDEQCDHTVAVAVTTLDSALSGMEPALIKIDVEGYETPVLEGAREILQNQALHAVIMELNGSGKRYGFDEAKILEVMRGNGFRPYSYNPLRRTLIALEGKRSDSDNTLFIRNQSFVEDRLRDARKVTIHGRQF